MIRIRGVSKSFADTTVLDGLDLDIPRQNVVTVIGPQAPVNPHCCAFWISLSTRIPVPSISVMVLWI